MRVRVGAAGSDSRVPSRQRLCSVDAVLPDVVLRVPGRAHARRGRGRAHRMYARRVHGARLQRANVPAVRARASCVCRGRVRRSLITPAWARARRTGSRGPASSPRQPAGVRRQRDARGARARRAERRGREHEQALRRSHRSGDEHSRRSQATTILTRPVRPSTWVGSWVGSVGSWVGSFDLGRLVRSGRLVVPPAPQAASMSTLYFRPAASSSP